MTGGYVAQANTPTARDQMRLMYILAAHFVFGFLVIYIPILWSVQTLLAYGFIFYTVLKRDDDGLIIGLFYLASMEAIWRGRLDLTFSHSAVQYAAGLSLLIASFRHVKQKSQDLLLEMMVLILLFIPIFIIGIITISLNDVVRSFKAMSIKFELLFVVYFFFMDLKVKRKTLYYALAMYIGGTIITLIVSAFPIITGADIQWGASSNPAASGGAGPNQIASNISFGLIGAFLLVVIYPRIKVGIKLVLIVFMVLFQLQTTLTFSRGGIYLFIMSLLAALPFYMMKSPNTRKIIIVSLTILIAVSIYLFPMLMEMTNSMIIHRYTNTDASKRTANIDFELEVFRENPVLGVGIGQSDRYRAEAGLPIRTHTFYSGFLAEGGIFALLILLIGFWRTMNQLFKEKDVTYRTHKWMLFVWMAGYMAVNELRTLIPFLLLGLVLAEIEKRDDVVVAVPRADEEETAERELPGQLATNRVSTN